MNGPDERLDAPADPAFEEMRGELTSLRTMLSVSLICLILLGLTMDRYLFQQVRLVHQQTQNIQQLEKNFHFDFVKASAFWSSLVTYSKTHPDFVPTITAWSQALNQTMITNGSPSRP
jgi:hypothetical protein